ncbi:hypothetical protein JCM10207_001784 [Rhodosporidiobolus poonsookiae]
MPRPTLFVALCAALAVLASSTGVDASAAPPPSLQDAAFFESYLSTHLDSYHSSLSPRARIPRSSSHLSRPSRYSSSGTFFAAPESANAAAVVPSEHQNKVARLSSLRAASGFARRTSAVAKAQAQGKALDQRGTRGGMGMMRGAAGERLVRRAGDEAASPSADDDAEGDDEAESEEGDEEDAADWTWMEEDDAPAEREQERKREVELSSAARMEIRMRRASPLFHREP